MIDDVRETEVVIAHSERVTLRVGDVFLKIDTDQTRIDREPEDAARVRVDRAAFRQGHDMQQQVTPGARGSSRGPSTSASFSAISTSSRVSWSHRTD
jgi:hypothetical protein